MMSKLVIAAMLIIAVWNLVAFFKPGGSLASLLQSFYWLCQRCSHLNYATSKYHQISSFITNAILKEIYLFYPVEDNAWIDRVLVRRFPGVNHHCNRSFNCIFILQF